MSWFFRILPVVIIGFWLTMSALLVRLNVDPDDAALLRVPVDHVLRIVFQHGLNSDLNIMKNQERLGNISLRPREIEAGEPRRVDFTGNLLLDLPSVARQTFRWQGFTRLTKTLELQEMSFQLELRKPSIRFQVQAGADKILHYTIEQTGFAVESHAMPLDPQVMLQTVLSLLGLEASDLNILPAGMNSPTVTAQQNHIHLRNEEIEVYQISIRSGELELATLYVSQLGQVLMAKSIFGYSLQAEDISL